MSGNATVNGMHAPVSVVIPTCRRPDGLRAALGSVLRQSLPPSEIVVVDDAREPRTSEVIDEFSGSGVSLMLRATPIGRGGAGAARNAGIAAASWPWIAFLDDDDEWAESKLESQFRVANDYDLVATNALRRSGSRYWPDSNDVEFTLEDVVRSNPIVTSSALVRRARIEAVGGFDEDRGIQGVEDYELWLRLLLQGARCIRIGSPEVLYEDRGDDRLSAREISQLRATSCVVHRLLRRRPLELNLWRGALVHDRALVMRSARARAESLRALA